MQDTKKKESRGRKPLNSYQTQYKIQKEAIQRVLKYFYEHNVKELFIKGSLSYGVMEDTIRIDYKIGEHTVYMDFKILLGNRRRADELKMLVQDFIVDNYLLHEWDGVDMPNIALARLYGVTPQDMNNIVRRIKDKILSKGDLLGY